MRTLGFMTLAAAALAGACQPRFADRPPAYSVDRSGPVWVARFSSAGAIRFHLKCGDPGYIETWAGPQRPLHIKPGQWLEWTYRSGGGLVTVSPPDLKNC